MNIKTKQVSKKLILFGVSVAVFLSLLSATPIMVSAQDPQKQAEKAQQQAEAAKKKAENDKAAKARSEAENKNFFGSTKGGYQCGKGDNEYKTRINFGCLGPAAKTNMTPVEDLLYSLVRFLSYGVGLVLIASMIVAGIQYSTSEGNPEATQAAKNRIRDAVIGLFIYLFAFAIVQYLVPGGLFN